MKKRLSIIGSCGIPSRYGGFETLAEELSHGLSGKYEISVYCSNKSYAPDERDSKWNNVTREFINLPANGVLSVFYDILSILRSSKNNDVILILGGSGTIITPLIRILKPKLKIIFHPDGLEWKRQKWNFLAKIFLFISIKIGCVFSNKIVLDNEGLSQYYKQFKKKTVYISYGEHPNPNSIPKKQNYWLTIARAEKENNLSMIANAFRKRPNENWKLLSNFKSTKYGKELYQIIKEYNNIELIDSNYNKDFTIDLISKCKGYIHGHATGGTNPTLVTAIWNTDNILCHNNIFNKETTKFKARYFNDSEQLKILLSENIDGKSNLNPLGKKYYSWPSIFKQYDELFESR